MTTGHQLRRMTCVFRQLLPSGVRVVLRAQSRLLRHPDLHPVMPHRRAVVGVVLVESRRRAGAGGARHHDRAHDDDAYLQHERLAAEDLLPEEYRRVPRHVLLHGVRVASRVRFRQLHIPRHCTGRADRQDGILHGESI